MPLSTLLSSYEPAYCDSWEEWFEFAWRQPTVRMQQLEQELRESPTGTFQSPVFLSEGEEVSVAAEEEPEYIPPVVRNGMHRIAVHHKLGVEEVLVTFDSESYQATLVDNPVLFLTIRYPQCPTPEQTALVAEKDDEWFSVLHDTLSWRHHGSRGSLWIASECYCVFLPEGDGQRGLYFVEPEDVEKVLLPEVFEDVASLITPLGCTLEEVGWEAFDDHKEEFYVLDSYSPTPASY